MRALRAIPPEASSRIEMLCAAGAALAVGAAVVGAADLPRAYQGALAGGAIGAILLLASSNRTLMLAVFWVLLHPLAIEKVFFVGTPLLPTFLPPTIVISASDAVFVALVAVLICRSVFTGARPFVWPSIATPFAALALWTALMALRAPSAPAALAVVQTLKMLLFIVAAGSAVSSRRELVILLAAMAFAVCLQSVLVLRSYLTGQIITFAGAVAGSPMTFSGAEGEQHIRAIGTVGHVNQQAAFQVFFTLPLLGLLALPRWRAKVLVFGIASLSMLAVIITFSRTAWLAAAAGAVVAALTAWRTGRLRGHGWFSLGAVLLIAACFCAVYARPILDRIVSGDEGATASRRRLTELALDLARSYPLAGVGPGGFIEASLRLYPYDRQETAWVHSYDQAQTRLYGRIEINEVTDQRTGTTYVVPLAVHNKFLLILSELGCIGLALFLWFQVATFVSLRRSLRRCSGPFLWAGIGIMGAFFATQCYMLFDLFAEDKPMAILLFPAVLAACYERAVAGEARA